MSKIIFLDIDGTFVNYEGQVPPSARVAVQQARENGHKIYLCTGRSRAEIYDRIWEVGFDGLIGANGSYIEDQGEVILNLLLSEKQCCAIVDWLKARGLEFFLESSNGLFASEQFEERGNSVMTLYNQRKGNETLQGVRDFFPNMVYNASLYRNDVAKISFILDSYQDHLDSVREFNELKCCTWGGAGETALFGDIGVKDVTKAFAIDTLLKHIHARVEDTIAFGDAKIDIPMLSYCAIGVAMESGGEEIKAMADMVTNGVDEDGLYHAFVKLGLIDENTIRTKL